MMAEGKARRAPPSLVLPQQLGLSLTVDSAVSAPALQKAALTVQACWPHLPAETSEASTGQALRSPIATAFKTLLENFQRHSVLGM